MVCSEALATSLFGMWHHCMALERLGKVDFRSDFGHYVQFSSVRKFSSGS